MKPSKICSPGAGKGSPARRIYCAATNYEFIAAPRFKRNFRALAKHHKKLTTELDAFLESFDPQAGKVAPGLHGARKIRMGGGGKGKRGGFRIMYYWTCGHTVYLLTIYSKAAQEDLSPEEKGELVQLIAEFQAKLER